MSSRRSSGEQRFSAAIERAGTQYCVEVPLRVSRALGGRGRIAVAARTQSGFAFNATLRPRGERHHLFLNDEARGGKKSGAITLTVRPVAKDRAVATPRDLTQALREADVLTIWASFPAGKREHIIRWIERAAHERTRDKRIALAVEVTERKRETKLTKREP